jgi:hypothetical protein
MILAWGAKARGHWRYPGPIFFRPLRVKGFPCTLTGRAAFLFRGNVVFPILNGEETMNSVNDRELYDLFLSYASANKEWVRRLAQALQALDLNIFFDEEGIESGDNMVITIDEALRNSRFLAVVLTKASVDRQWVIHEWTTFKAALIMASATPFCFCTTQEYLTVKRARSSRA